MITVKMNPKEGGKLHLDGRTFDPRIPYPAGSQVRIKILPLGDYQFAGWSGDVPQDHKADVPLEMTVSDEPQQVVANFVAGVEHASDLVFESDFENGNGTPRYIYRRNRMIVFEPEQIKGADNIWWHFKIHGITPGEFLQIWPLSSSLGDEENIAWAGDCHPVYSYDGEAWHRFSGMWAPYVQQFTERSVEIARNIPYSYSRTLALAEEMKGPHVQVLTLATSEEGRGVKTFRFTDPDVPDGEKQVVWLMARQHAFESHSSWYAEGVIRWLQSEHELAAELRRRAICYVTPIMDVDNVYNGGSGKEQLGPDGTRADFNRCWGNDTPWAAIRAAKRLLMNLKQQHDIAVFIDLHNPWYPRPSYWGISVEFADEVLPFAKMWSECLKETSTSVRWKHDLRIEGARVATGEGVAGHMEREPTRDMIGGGAWARQALIDRTEDRLFFAIEIAHWKDGYGNFVDIKSLRAYGEAMGRALAKWFMTKDRKK